MPSSTFRLWLYHPTGTTQESPYSIWSADQQPYSIYNLNTPLSCNLICLQLLGVGTFNLGGPSVYHRREWEAISTWRGMGAHERSHWVWSSLWWCQWYTLGIRTSVGMNSKALSAHWAWTLKGTDLRTSGSVVTLQKGHGSLISLPFDLWAHFGVSMICLALLMSGCNLGWSWTWFYYLSICRTIGLKDSATLTICLFLG